VNEILNSKKGDTDYRSLAKRILLPYLSLHPAHHHHGLELGFVILLKKTFITTMANLKSLHRLGLLGFLS
jgi:hypothetical protein